MRTLVTGGTGFVGRHLLALLDDPVLVSRIESSARAHLGNEMPIIEWNPASGPLPIGQLKDRAPEAVINLMGESVADGRWTKAKKERIRTSRVDGTRNLFSGLSQLSTAPRVFVNASAVGFFGDGGETELTESSPGGTGFLSDVCREWEEAANQFRKFGTRVVNLRIGLVMGNDGGALKSLLPVYRWCAGGRLGSGRQWMPWIHVRDLARMFVWCRDNESITGPIHGSAPEPVRNSEFTRELARSVGRPAILPAPQFAVRMALGEFANSLFQSQRMIPAKALAGGFDFQFKTLQSALKDLIP